MKDKLRELAAKYHRHATSCGSPVYENCADDIQNILEAWGEAEGDAEEVAESLSDDAELIRRQLGPDNEVSENMERAAEILLTVTHLDAEGDGGDVHRRIGWMLESVDGKGWWDGRARWDFTHDPNGAVVFPNRSSADFHRLMAFHGEVIVTEHVWVSGTQTPVRSVSEADVESVLAAAGRGDFHRNEVRAALEAFLKGGEGHE